MSVDLLSFGSRESDENSDHHLLGKNVVIEMDITRIGFFSWPFEVFSATSEVRLAA